jgi:hypothetical protein
MSEDSTPNEYWSHSIRDQGSDCHGLTANNTSCRGPVNVLRPPIGMVGKYLIAATSFEFTPHLAFRWVSRMFPENALAIDAVDHPFR